MFELKEFVNKQTENPCIIVGSVLQSIVSAFINFIILLLSHLYVCVICENIYSGDWK